MRAFSFSRDPSAQLVRYYAHEQDTLARRPLHLLVSGLLASTSALAAQDPDRVALEAAIHRWTTAVNAQDVDALNATMTEDVELLDETATVTGRDACHTSAAGSRRRAGSWSRRAARSRLPTTSPGA